MQSMKIWSSHNLSGFAQEGKVAALPVGGPPVKYVGKLRTLFYTHYILTNCYLFPNIYGAKLLNYI
jgi:hypothetical protein